LKKLHDLINYGWQIAKMMFETPSDFSRLIQIGNEAIKNTPEGKDREFVRKMINAILDYMECEWRESKANEGNNGHREAESSKC